MARRVYFAVAKNDGKGGRPDDGRWTWAPGGPDTDPGTGAYTVHASGTRSTSALARQAADRFVYVRPCASCGGGCLWTEDAWVCRRCGDEWYPDSGEPYNLLMDDPVNKEGAETEAEPAHP